MFHLKYLAIEYSHNNEDYCDIGTDLLSERKP